MKKFWRIVKDILYGIAGGSLIGIGILCLLVLFYGIQKQRTAEEDFDMSQRNATHPRQSVPDTEPVASYSAPGASQPSAVYKCKTKAGKTIIQTQPCEGDARTIDVRQAAITTPEQEREAERRLEMFREMNRKRDEEAIRLLLAREAARQEQLESQRQRRFQMEMPQPNFQSPSPRRYANDDFKPLTPSCVPTIILPGNVDNCGNFYQGGCNNVGGGQFNCYDPIAPTPSD